MWCRSNYGIAELTWENGQLGMNGLSGFLQTKAATEWEGRSNRTNETLESIVHQATRQNNSGEKWAETSCGQAAVKKRSRSESNNNGGTLSMNGSNCMEGMSGRESTVETNSMSWANSFDSSPSFKHKTSTFEDSASLGCSENQDEDGETKTETVKSGAGSGSSRSRAAAVHNQSERRRRDRINQKIKALQKLVPNASKTDKASMLDEVIEYLKQLQAQIEFMSSASARNMPQMMMSLGMQHQLHINLLSRMGMPNNNTTPFPPPPFILPSSILQPHLALPPPPPINMEMYNKMAEVYMQQVTQATHGNTNQ